MLMPKKVKYRKQQRGRMTGKAWRGGTLAFGQYGLKVLEPGWITDRQIEASRGRPRRRAARAGGGGRRGVGEWRSRAPRRGGGWRRGCGVRGSWGGGAESLLPVLCNKARSRLSPPASQKTASSR